jgi:hypothetical protein
VGDKQLSLNQIPTNLVGLDRRPTGLNNGVTVNYGVDNDKWFPVTNSRMALLAKLTRHSAGNQTSERKKYGRNRVVVFVILGFVAAAPMIIFALKAKQTISQKQS